MAYTCPHDLDGFMPHLPKNDTKFRQQLGADLLAYLAEPSNQIICQDIGQLVDGLIPWMQSSNYKVSSNGIEIMTYLADRLCHDFRPYLQTVLPCVIDRLGDAKDSVREKAQLLILKLLEREVLQPQSLLEKLTPGFTHKNAKIREEVLRCLVNTLNEHGAQSVQLSKFIPHIVKLLADPASSVRDTAFATLVDLYKHVGEKLRIDLQKRNLVPAPKLAVLLARFDEVRDAGELFRTATIAADLVSDEVDRMAMPKPSIPAKKIGLGSAVKKTPSNSRNPPTPYASGGAGAVDEEVFLKQFEDVPTLQLFTPREVNDHMKSIQDTISDANKDWNKRAESLKKIRSLVIAGATNFEDFHANLRNLELPLQVTIKDLRSQVVREACITIAFLAQTLGSKFDHTAEFLLNPLINLIQNSAKIMATSGLTCVRFLIQYTQSPRLIPIITSNLQNSKSKEIRRSCCEFLEVILSYWPTHPLERHIVIIQESVKRGIADADPEARVIARKAFRGFREHFPDQAEALIQSLEPSYRKALQSELCLSSSSSSGSLAQTPALNCRTNRLRTPQTTDATNGRKGFRSNSAIDLQAAQRAKARNQYSAMARQKIASGTASLPRPKKTEVTPPMTASPERSGRSRSRTSGVSHSQPTSRSGSPSSRFSYLYNRSHAADSDSPRPRRMSSGIPRSITGSRDTSRETSPTRSTGLSRFRRNSDRPPMSPASRPPVMAQRILQQSREAENALADALTYEQADGDYQRISSPRKMRSIENHSDDSETSSVCSERSFDSFRRPSDSYSWSGSQNRLSNRDYMWEPSHDITEIIAACASTVWQERKDGLVSLQHYLANGAMLTPGELKHITEICTRMFVDSHTKGMSVFLDTVNELIKKHSADLHDWLNVLLLRIFNKLGTDLLMTAQSKLQTTLDNVKTSFPIPLQMAAVYKILVDSFQTPNTKVRVAVLTYLAALCRIAEPAQFVNAPPAALALAKIISFVRESKSSDIRNAARVCIVAMWNCNIPSVTIMLSELPKELQDVASDVVRNQMRASASNNGSPRPPTSPGTPTHNYDLNSEEIYRSLKRTTAEIQNYSYETLGSKLDRDRDTTSHDSGISQMSVGNNDVRADIATIEEGIERMHLRASYATHSHNIHNGMNDTESNGFDKSISEEEVVQAVVKYCILDNPLPVEQKCVYMEKLIPVIKQGNLEPVIQHFKPILRIFLECLNKCETEVKLIVIVLNILSEILQRPELEECWSNFIELLTLRVLGAICSDNRDIRAAAENTTAAMGVFPFNTVITTLSPYIQTSCYPRLDGAMKMITRIIDQRPNELTDEHLNSLMPGLVKANDHEESAVRKSAVFCMVVIHRAVGEDRMAPHLKALPGSKMKLVRIYIDKGHSNKDGKSARHLKPS